MDLSWFRLDPFFIFGLGVELLLIGYFGVYMPIRLWKWNKLRSKMTDKEALAWAKVINNPDSPSRPTKESIDRMMSKLR